MQREFEIRQMAAIIPTTTVSNYGFDYNFNIFQPIYKEVSVIDSIVINCCNMKCQTIIFLCSEKEIIPLKKKFGDIILHSHSKDNTEFIKTVNVFYISLPEKYLNYYNNSVFNVLYAGYIYSKIIYEVLQVKTPTSYVLIEPHKFIDPFLLLSNNSSNKFCNFFYNNHVSELYEKQMSFCVDKDQYAIMNRENVISAYKDMQDLIKSGISKEEFFKKDISFFIGKYTQKERIYQNSKDIPEIKTFDLSKWENYISLCKYIIEYDKYYSEMLRLKMFMKKHNLTKIGYDNIKIDNFNDFQFSIKKKSERKIRREIMEWKKTRERIRGLSNN